jgi:hypothetical protein
MKTALQELLDWMNTQMFIKPKDLYSKVRELLPKEKEQLEDAYFQGVQDDRRDYLNLNSKFESFEDYYTKTYNNEASNE